MGYYINRTSKGQIGLEKAQALLDDGAKEIEQPKEFQENVVCVVSNGFFEAAGYMYNESVNSRLLLTRQTHARKDGLCGKKQKNTPSKN